MKTKKSQDHFSELGQAAQRLAALGLAVLPLTPKTKIPLKGTNGVKNASADPDVVRARWTTNPDANIGIAAGASKLLVLDVDGDIGEQSTGELTHQLGDLLDTVTVITPGKIRDGKHTGKGRHLYFRATTGQTVAKVGLRPGLDLRTGDTYVVGPPSIHPDGGRYEFEKGKAFGEIPVAELPVTWIEFLAASACGARSSGKLDCRFLAPQADAAKRAKAYLDQCPAAVQGSNGHGTLLSVANALLGFFADSAAAADFAWEHYNPRCVPPWSDRERKDFERKFTEAARTSTNEPGRFLRDDPPLTWNEFHRRQGKPSDNHVGDPARSDGEEEKRNPLEWEPFPIEVFPATLRNYCTESAAACHIDPAFVAPFVLAVVASTLGPAFKVQPKKGWFEPSILWTALVAGSGSGKSPGLDAAVDPLRTFQRTADDRYREARKQFEADWTVYEADLTAWKARHRKSQYSSEEPPERPKFPVPETFLIDDATMEAVAEVLGQNPFGVIMTKDELSGWLGCFNAYRTGGDKDSPFWLAVHGGRYYRSNRKTGDKIITVNAPAVSVCGGIQPGILRKVLGENEHFFDSGLVGRILFAMPPDKSARWSETVVADETKERYVEVLKTILGWRSDPDAPTPENPQILGMTEAAKRLFVDFCNENADERDDMVSESIQSFWPKLTGYAARIALVLHVVRWIESETLGRQVLDADSMRSAITLVNWFKREAVRIVQMVRGEDCTVDFEAKTILAAIRKNGGETTARDLQRRIKSYGNEGGADRADRKLREMVASKTLAVRREQAEKGGRPKEIFYVVEPDSVDTTPDLVDTTPPKNTPKVDRTPIFPGKNRSCVNCQPGESSEVEFSEVLKKRPIRGR